MGRKQVLTAPPVKEVALEHGTPVFQPRTLRDGGEDANIRALAPEADRGGGLRPASCQSRLLDKYVSNAKGSGSKGMASVSRKIPAELSPEKREEGPGTGSQIL